MKDIRLGIYHSALRSDGVSFFTIPPFARYLNYIAPFFKELVIMAPLTEEPNVELSAVIRNENVRVISLPYFQSAKEAALRGSKIKRILCNSVSEIDALWMRYPNQHGESLFWQALNDGKKVVLQIVGDPLDAIENTDKYRGIERLVARFVAMRREKRAMKMCEVATVFTNGSALHAKFSRNGRLANVRKIISSALIEEDYYERDDTCRYGRVNLLYVGYLQRRKGLTHLINAFGELRRLYGNIYLTIVGEGEDRAELEETIKRHDLTGFVHMAGWIPMGKELNDIHRRSDIFVFPTLAGEGTPRAILNAMANSLPVIATSVAGIPDVLRNEENGININAASSASIVRAVERMIKDGDLRRKIIRNGYRTARCHSMKDFLNCMLGDPFVS